jgi:hypothetical protein
MWHHSKWPEVTFANIAFGQGISVTPLQLAIAMAALGNGGHVMRPLLIKEVRDRAGNIVQQNAPQVMRRVFTQSALDLTRRALSKVVTEGTGSLAAVEGYPVGGKTGTPEKINPRTRRYAKTHWMGNFIGLAPMDNPRIAVIVMVDEPNPVRLGGKVAAPAFAEIVTQALPYLGEYPAPVYGGSLFRVPTVEQHPDEPAPIQAPVLAPALAAGTNANANASSAPDNLDAYDRDALNLDADPEALDDWDDPIALAARDDDDLGLASPFIAAPSNEQLVPAPDLRQLSMRDALRHARAAGLSLEARDHGFVIEQWPAPGELMPKGEQIQVTLARRYRAPTVGLTP